MGLKPIVRHMWWVKGMRPIVRQQRRYQWMHVFAFVHPTSGRSEYLLLPFVNTAAMQYALDAFTKFANPTGDKIIVVLVDRAGWHRTDKLIVPEGIRLFPLPPYSPELQPAERVWPLLGESAANRPIKTLDRLERILVNRCRYFLEHPEELQKYVGYEWIVKAEARVTRD